MQDAILEQIASTISEVGLVPTQQAQYGNTGTVYGMSGLDTLVRVSYSFQSGYCTLAVYEGAQKEPLTTFHHLEYEDGDRLREMLDLVRRTANVRRET